MDEPSRIADAFPRYVPAKTPEPTASDIAAAQLVREQHAPHMVTYACLECGERWPCRPYRRAEQLLIGAGVDLESSGGNSPLLACGRSLAGTGEEQRVSKIDETISAIQAALSQLGETQAAIGNAGNEADEAHAGAAALGADGVAQAMSQCKDALDKAQGACGAVSDALEEAISAARSAVG